MLLLSCPTNQLCIVSSDSTSERCAQSHMAATKYHWKLRSWKLLPQASISFHFHNRNCALIPVWYCFSWNSTDVEMSINLVPDKQNITKWNFKAASIYKTLNNTYIDNCHSDWICLHNQVHKMFTRITCTIEKVPFVVHRLGYALPAVSL